MTSEMPLFDEIGQDGLVESGRKNIRSVASGRKCGYQVRRNNHVTPAQSGKQDLAESSDIGGRKLAETRFISISR